MAVTWKKLAYEEDVVLKSLFNANTILAAAEDDTPAALEVAASSIVGRKATGGIVALTAAELLAILGVESGADVTDATNVAGAGAVMESDFTAKGDLIVGSGAGTAVVVGIGTAGQVLSVGGEGNSGLQWADAGTPAAHAASHKNAGGDELLLHELGEPTGAVALDGQQLTNHVIHTVADETARLALTPVVGKLAFQGDVLAPYICTAAA